MKILLVTKLSDNKLKEKITPITKTKCVSSIDIIRYKSGHALSKVKYYTPANLLSKNIIFQLLAVFILIPLRIVISRPDYLMAIYNVPYGVFMSLFGRIFKIPVIISLIGDDIHVYESKPFLWGFFINQWRSCSVITTTGNSTRDILVKNGLKKEKVIALPNPVDIYKFQSKDMVKEFDIITVSYLIKRKKIDVLLKAVADIKNTKLKVCIIGDGPEKEHLIELARKSSILDSTIFLGHIENVNDYLLKSRIFILPSEAEGMPVAVLEAMASGLAVIATDVGDTSDIVKDMENGLLIKPNDKEILVEKINYLLKNPQEIERLSNNALKIRETNSYRAIGKIWEKILGVK